MKKIYFLLMMVIGGVSGVLGQAILTNAAPSVTIDFSNSMQTSVGSNPTMAFSGAGFDANTAVAGRLNSNAWATTGFSDGSLAFGGTNTTGDHARGAVNTAQNTGGIYAYTGAPGSVANPTLMIQPGGTDFTPGTLTLRIQNNGTTNITSLSVSYNIYIRNDQGYSNSLNFSHSNDNITYTPVGALDYASPAAADAAGWVVVPGAPSRTTTIGSLNVAPGAFFYIRWTGDDVSGSGSRDEFGLDDINLTATFSSGATPNIALSSPNPAIAAANVEQGALNHPIYRFDLAVTTADAILNGVTINTSGTYAATDFTNFKCWYSTDAVFSPATDMLLSTLAPVATAGPQVFPAFVNQSITAGNTGYIFISADLPCNAVVANDISVDAITTADISFVDGNKTGTAFAGGLQTIVVATPNNVTVPAASVANMSSNLTWTNPAGCYDEVLIVARANTANDGVPTGDGTAYTADLNYGAGTALGNGFVVYKGLASGQTVTGLTNGIPYYYKFFTRLGTTWSAGIEINQTPAVVTLNTDYFRSRNNGDWGLITTWESSPDDISYVNSTLIPDENANTIRIQTGHIVTVALPQSADQLIVETGATLALATVGTFTLADGLGTDMIVDGTVINTLGTNTITGTIAFNAGSLYQHNRDGGTILPASWNLNSTAEIIGIVTATSLSGANQSFGNFTWNNIAQTSNLNLTGSLTTVNGNFWLQNSGPASSSLRLTGATPLNLVVGGNFTVEDDLNIDNSATGTTAISIGGNFVHSAGLFESSSSLVTITMTGASNSFNQSGGTFTNGNLNWVIDAGAEITLLSNLPLATSRSLIVNGILNCGLRSVNGTGAITVNGGGRARVGSLNAGGAVNDNLSASAGLTLNAGSTIEFNGLSPQYMATRTFSNVEINNANGVTAVGAVTVNDVLGLTDGIVYTTATNLLTMVAGSSYTGGTGNNNYVQGPVSKIGNTDFTFPLGRTAAGWGGNAAIRISGFVGGAATDEFRAEYRRGNANSLGPITAPFIDHVSRCDYWVLDLIAGTPTVDITAFWSTNNVCGGTYIDNLADLELVHFNGVSWDNSSWGFSFINGNTTTGDITWPGVSVFSPFALGSTSLDNPLPISLNYFTGTRQNNKHLLNWKVTCNSVPSVTMELERSADGVNFSSISTIYASALRCEQPFDYVDAAPLKGVNYYRLKMIDSDGKISYSSRVALTNNSKGIDVMNIAPNPIVGGRFNVRINTASSTRAELLISDMQGRMLQSQTANIIAGFNNIPVQVQRLAAGTYQLLLITADGDRKLLRFVVQ